MYLVFFAIALLADISMLWSEIFESLEIWDISAENCIEWLHFYLQTIVDPTVLSIVFWTLLFSEPIPKNPLIVPQNATF